MLHMKRNEGRCQRRRQKRPASTLQFPSSCQVVHTRRCPLASSGYLHDVTKVRRYPQVEPLAVVSHPAEKFAPYHWGMFRWRTTIIRQIKCDLSCKQNHAAVLWRQNTTRRSRKPAKVCVLQSQGPRGEKVRSNHLVSHHRDGVESWLWTCRVKIGVWLKMERSSGGLFSSSVDQLLLYMMCFDTGTKGA
ncbi:uncharacterized protein LOC144005465 isoform X2 [Festucalex cinctus]